jgi:hypothetical protein
MISTCKAKAVIGKLNFKNKKINIQTEKCNKLPDRIMEDNVEVNVFTNCEQ